MQSQKYKVFPFSRFCHETTRIRCEAQIVRNSEGQEFAFLICAPCCRRISECRAPAPIGGLTHAVSGDLSVHRGRGSLCAAFCYCSSNGSIEQAMSKCCLIWNVRQSFEAVHHRANSRSIIYKIHLCARWHTAQPRNSPIARPPSTHRSAAVTPTLKSVAIFFIAWPCKVLAKWMPQ